MSTAENNTVSGIPADKQKALLSKFKNISDKKKNTKFVDNSSLKFKVEENVEKKVRLVHYSDKVVNGQGQSFDFDPSFNVAFHFNVMGKYYYCPKNDNEPCPFCEMASVLWEEYNQSKNEAIKKIARAVTAKSRFYLPVVERPETAVKYWSVGDETYRDITKMFLDEEIGFFYDTLVGRDLKVTGEKANREGGSYTKPSILPSMQLTPLFSLDGSKEADHNKINALKLSVQNPVEALGLRTTETYDDLRKILDAWDASGWRTGREEKPKANNADNGASSSTSENHDEESSNGSTEHGEEASASVAPSTESAAVNVSSNQPSSAVSDDFKSRIERMKQQQAVKANG